MTFSSYKNRNTFKVLAGISPGGAVTFVSKLFPGSLTDKQLTRRSELLELLDRGDCVMADRGFDIQDDLTTLHGSQNQHTSIFERKATVPIT